MRSLVSIHEYISIVDLEDNIQALTVLKECNISSVVVFDILYLWFRNSDLDPFSDNVNVLKAVKFFRNNMSNADLKMIIDFFIEINVEIKKIKQEQLFSNN